MNTGPLSHKSRYSRVSGSPGPIPVGGVSKLLRRCTGKVVLSGRGISRGLLCLLLAWSAPVPMLPDTGPTGSVAVDTPPPAVSIRLPDAGRHPAETLFRALETLTGKAVLVDDEALREIPLHIGRGMGGKPGDVPMLKLILGAHGVFLHTGERDRRSVWLASASPRAPRQNPRPPRRITRVFDVPRGSFRRAVEEVEKYVLEKNRTLGPGAPETRFIPVPGTRRIIVRTHARRILDTIEEIVRGVGTGEKYPEGQARLYVHVARNHRARDLHEKLLGFLSDGEKKRVHCVFPRKSNALWIRTHPKLWTKLERILRVADVPATESATRRAGDAGKPGPGDGPVSN